MRVEPNRNVYVGHRYVPKIFGEWDVSNEYEGLSIVTHQGNSYTSKKRVPVGIDILNEEFWVVTGNYNAQVDYYRDDVLRLKETVSENKNLSETSDEELSNRIDENKNALDNKVDTDLLNQYHVNVKEYGAMGDGSNQTTELQNAINSSLSIFIPTGKYYFDKLIIDKSNTSIEIAEGVVFESPEDTMNVNSGAIEIKGDGIQFSANLANNTNEMDTTIYVDDTNGFLPGDFVKIDQVNPSGNTHQDHRQKFISTIARIKAVDPVRRSITFIEAIPHAFQINNQAKVHKIDMIENVTIKGAGLTEFDKMFTESYANFIVADFVHNLKISEFEFFNGGGKGIRLQNVHTYDVRDCLLRNPTVTTSGQGYGFQAEIGSCYGYINNFESFDCRHSIDFAKGAHHCLIENSTSYGGGFNGHGMNTKYIHFKHCHAFNCGFGIGNNSFHSDELWTFEDCHVYNYPVGFSISNASNNIKILNCSCKKTTTSFMIQQDSYDVDIINFTTEDCVNGGDIRKCNNLRINGYFISDFENTGLMVRMGAEDIRLEKVYIRDAKTTEGGVEGIILNGVKHVQIIDPVFVGDMRRAISFNDNSENILIDRIDCDINAPIAIDINNTNDIITDVKSYIKNAIQLKCDGNALYTTVGGLNIINCDIDGMILEESSTGYNIINNHIKKSLNVRSTQNTSIIGNFGNAVVNLPVENETVVIGMNRF